MSRDKELSNIRCRIDEIDSQLLALMNERARCAQQVAKVKLDAMHSADEGCRSYYRPEREAQILRAIRARNTGPLTSDHITLIFRELMSGCLSLEKSLSVAFLGPIGTYSQAAVLKHFGSSVVAESQNSIQEVFRQVEQRQCDYGVVPVENSTEGMVGQTLDCFLGSSLKIVGEIELSVVHHLLTQEEASIESIQLITGHEQALAQCRQWLDSNLPNALRETVPSNGVAVQRAMGDCTVAAIAGDLAAKLYGLKKCAQAIQDSCHNTTRFLVLGHQLVPPSGYDKTSLLVSARNRPGALLGLLRPFEESKISLTRIDSRPSKTEKWTYVFYIECEGHINDELLHNVFSQIEEHSIMLKKLGAYPRASL